MFYGASPKLFEYAKELREKETEAEKLLWKYLSNNQLLGLRFRRQHPIKYFIADFYCHQIRLIVELDGGVHTIPEQFEYDQNRDFELEQLGLKVLRFTNDELNTNIDQVLEEIREEVLQRKGQLITEKL